MIKNFYKEIFVFSLTVAVFIFFQKLDLQTYTFFIKYYHAYPNEYLKKFFIKITSLGNSAWYFSISIFLIIILLVLKKITADKIKFYLDKIISINVFLFISVLLTGFITQILKHIIGRPRPKNIFLDLPVDMPIGKTYFDFFTRNVDFHSFPSGHAATIFVVRFVFAFFFPKIKYYIFLLFSVIAFSRVFIGVHFLSDVIAGLFVAYFSYFSTKLILKKFNYFNNKSIFLNEYYLLFIIFFIFVVFLSVAPSFDLFFSNIFYKGINIYGDHDFYLQGSDILTFIFRKLLLPLILIYILILPIISLFLPINKIFFNYIFSLKDIIFIWASSALGVIGLVNLVFKNMWGRVRPNDLRDFGGDGSFTPWYELSNICDLNCSFVSGDSSVGFLLIIFFFLIKKKSYLFIALLFGFSLGLIRIMEGGHFLSDVLFSCLLVFSFSQISYLFYKKKIWADNQNYLIIPIIFLIVVKTIASASTNYSLYGDEAQYWLWSKELSLGYYSKPPLLPWVISFFTSIFGNGIVVIKLIPSFFYLISSLLIYQLSLRLFHKKGLALCAAITFLLLPAATLSSYILSTDVPLIFFWILSLIQLINIEKKQTSLNFLLLGIFVGLAFLSKYAAIYFFLCLFVLLIISPYHRKFFLISPKKFLFLIFGFVVVALPNIIWNFNNNWITIGHTSDNASLDNLSLNFLGALDFAASQIIMVGPILFFVGFVLILKGFKVDKNISFLLCFSLPVLALMIIQSFLVKANANWAAVSLVALSVLLTKVVYSYSKSIAQINNYFNLVLAFALFIVIGTNYPLRGLERVSGYKDLKLEIKKENYNNIDNFVVSDRIIFSTLSYEYRNTNLKFYMPKPVKNKITNHFQMSRPLPENFKESFLLIGSLNDINYILTNKKYVSTRLIVDKKFPFSKESLRVIEVYFFRSY